MCGENDERQVQQLSLEGSSPRVRGKPYLRFEDPARRRLIPACAGKTTAFILQSPHLGAHPRVCGENMDTVRYGRRNGGSSPRVRGKRRWPWRGTSGSGLIPACAGKTYADSVFYFVEWAHPRVCGENSRRRSRERRGPGSSPRVRGKQRRRTASEMMKGLIPACAGKTRSSEL